jgi:HprK-related kinase A
VILAELSDGEVARRAAQGALALWCGPFVVRVTTPLPAVHRGMVLQYSDHTLADDGEFADFHLELGRPSLLRRIVSPQVVFRYGDEAPLTPLGLDQAYALYEWALNWAIASNANQYLILHSAVVERGGRVLLLPGPPGSGKSTLTAGLVMRGWRLFSDELTLIEPASRRVAPLPRPVSLKNESLPAIRSFAPDAIIGEIAHNTQKGSVGHMKPRRDDVLRQREGAGPGWIVFPKFTEGAAAELAPRGKPDTLLELGRNAFNYHMHRGAGFEALADFVDRSGCYDFRFGSLEDGVAAIDRLVAEAS